MIQPLLPWYWLLSVESGGRLLWGRFDHQRPEYDAGYVLMVLIAAAVVAAAGLVLLRLLGSFRTESKRALFRELCRAHRLRTSRRRLLRRLAAARGLTHAANLFVEPRYFNTNNLPPSLQQAKGELQRLHDLLFM
jgi:hypothetical protein